MYRNGTFVRQSSLSLSLSLEKKKNPKQQQKTNKQTNKQNSKAACLDHHLWEGGSGVGGHSRYITRLAGDILTMMWLVVLYE